MATPLSVIEIPLADIHTVSPLGRLFLTEGLGKWGAATTEKTYHRRLLDDDVAELARRTDPHLVLSLMAPEERATWSMQRLPLVLGVYGIVFAEHPIDIVSGGNDGNVARAAFAVRAALTRGRSVVILGRGRRGRSVRVATTVLMALGMRSNDASRIVSSVVEGTSPSVVAEEAARMLPAVHEAFVDLCVPHRYSRSAHPKAVAALCALSDSSRSLSHLALAFAETLGRSETLNLHDLASFLSREPSMDGQSDVVDLRLWNAWRERARPGRDGVPTMATDDGDVDERALATLMAVQVPIAYLCFDDPERLSDLATLTSRLVTWKPFVAVAAQWTGELFAAVFGRHTHPLPTELATRQLERLRSYPGLEGDSATANLLRRFLQEAAEVLNEKERTWDAGAPYAPILSALHHALWRPDRSWWQHRAARHAPAVLDCVGALDRRRNSPPQQVASSSSVAMGIFACLHNLGYEGLRNATYLKDGVMSVRFSFATEVDFQAMRRHQVGRARPFLQAITKDTKDPALDLLHVVFEIGTSAGAVPAVREYPISWGPARIAESIASQSSLREHFRACAMADGDHVAWYRRVLQVAGTRGVLLYDFDDDDVAAGDRTKPIPHVIRYPFSDVRVELPGRRWVRAGVPSTSS